MKRTLLTVGLIVLGVIVSSAYADTTITIAMEEATRITNITPVMKTMREEHPYQVCEERVVYEKERSGDGSYTNELIGGLFGNQFGGGSGKKVATLGGAVLGASIANDNESNRTTKRIVEDCRTEYRTSSSRMVDYYEVTYHFDNQKCNSIWF